MLLPFTGVPPVRLTRAICGQEGFDLTPSLAKLGSRRPDCGPVGLMSWTATGSSQWGQGPPGPTLRAKVLQSAQRWMPRDLGPAGLALVDRGSPGQAGREGCRCPLKGPPRPLAAGGRAVALPAGRDEARPQAGQVIVAAARQACDPQAEAWMLTGVGVACRRLRLFDEAIGCLQQALAMHRDMRDRRGMVWEWGYLGLALQRARGMDAARACWQEARTIFTELGVPRSQRGPYPPRG